MSNNWLADEEQVFKPNELPTTSTHWLAEADRIVQLVAAGGLQVPQERKNDCELQNVELKVKFVNETKVTHRSELGVAIWSPPPTAATLSSGKLIGLRVRKKPCQPPKNNIDPDRVAETYLIKKSLSGWPVNSTRNFGPLVTDWATTATVAAGSPFVTHSTLLALLTILKPGGPPKLGRHARRSKGEADVNVRKERARTIVAECIMVAKSRCSKYCIAEMKLGETGGWWILEVEHLGIYIPSKWRCTRTPQ